MKQTKKTDHQFATSSRLNAIHICRTSPNLPTKEIHLTL